MPDISTARPPRVAPGQPARVVLQLLGEPALVLDGHAVAGALWRRTHARRLLQYLGSSPRGAELRLTLQAALWPEFDEARGRNRLHHTLHWVRKALEVVPEALRPQILVQEERVQLVLPQGASIDWCEHIAALEGDEADAALRLAALETTLARHGGEFAVDWVGGHSSVDARRAWLAERRNRALCEAVELARELGLPEVAIRHARHRARCHPEDVDAQCDYALLLKDNGRAEAALLHCTHVRALIVASDDGEPDALAQIDSTMRTIQQHNNLEAPAPLPLEAPRRVVSRHGLAPPRAAMLGYADLQATSGALLSDSYTAILTLVGPPGAGKSLLAAHVAHRFQEPFRHGAVAVPALHCHHPEDLWRAVGQALEPLTGQPVTDWAGLHAALAGKELLLLIDDLPREPALAQCLWQMASVHTELKWLVTCWAPLGLRNERSLRVDPALLLEPEQAGSPSPAAMILAARLAGTPAAAPWPALEQLAQAVDGLPRALELAAERLHVMSMPEFMTRLEVDPGSLLADADAAPHELGATLEGWLRSAVGSHRPSLAALALCQGWLTRSDVQSLHACGHDEVDVLVDHAVRHHHLRRRVRSVEGSSRSEFRVPRMLRAALAAAGDAAEQAAARERVLTWIEQGPPTHAVAESRIAWLDDRLPDVDAAVRHWAQVGAGARLRAFCVLHMPHWSLTRHPRTVLRWLDAALERGEGTEPDAAERAAWPALLLARARLRVRTQQVVAACDDAHRALMRLGGDGDSALRQEALSLLQRHGKSFDNVAPATDLAAADTRGIEAAQALLGVAQLAVRHGRYAQALSVCEQGVELFRRFGVAHGQVKALHYRARIALAMGQLELAEGSVAAAADVVMPAARQLENGRRMLFGAELALHRGQFDEAHQQVRKALARPDVAAYELLVARGLQIGAWAHHAQGAGPLALGLCREAHRVALAAAHAGMVSNAHVLEALLSARQGQRDSALHHIAAAIARLEAERPSADLQFELVNAAELGALLGQPRLAHRLLAALARFGAAPGHALRPWIEQRATALLQTLGSEATDASVAGDDDTPSAHVLAALAPSDVLRQLSLA